MPAVRPFYRRKSSHAIFSPAKPGIYGIAARSQAAAANVNVTFAPNVTPTTFTEPDPDDDPANPLPSLAADAREDDAAGPNVKALRAQIFPASEPALCAGPKKRKRAPPGKRPSQGYIPRPPNAFMLYRADFVKQRHVPGSVEPNDASLSKIIGTCWRQLPLDEKRVWEKRAKEEKAAHKVRFPDYRFRPVHNKNKNTSTGPTINANANTKTTSKATALSKSKQPSSAEAEQRCDDISRFMLEGKSGDELEEAILIRDQAHSHSHSRSLSQTLESGHDLQLGLNDEYEYEYDHEHELQLDEPPESPELELELGFGADHHQHQHPHGASPVMPMHMPAPLQLHPHLPYGMGMDNGHGAFSAPAHTQLGFNPHLQLHPNTAMDPNSNMLTNLNANVNMNMTLGRRRSSSVPLPNDWQWYAAARNRGSISGSFLQPAIQSQAVGGITIPTIPPFASRPPSEQEHSHNDTDNLEQGHFTNPFQSPPQQQQQTTTTANYDFTSVLPSASTQFSPALGSQQQQGLFHPSPQRAAFFPTPSPRSSLGLRRASSVNAMFGRPSWSMLNPMQMPMPMMDNFDYRMSVGGSQLGMELGMHAPMGMGMHNHMQNQIHNQMRNEIGMQMEMQRDDSPLPEVDPGLFADFSFGVGKNEGGPSAAGLTHQRQHHNHQRVPSVSEEAVDPVAPAPISVIPSLSSSSPTTASVSSSTSNSGSPVPSNGAYNPLDGSYTLIPNSNSMGGGGVDLAGGYVSASDSEGVYGMQAMYGYGESHNHVDPLMHAQAGKMPAPPAAATESGFGVGLHHDAGTYFESG